MATLIDMPDEATILGTLCADAIQKAMSTAAIIVCTLDGERQLRRTDIPDLERAGMAGWEVEIYRIVGDLALSQTLRGKALRSYREARPRVALEVRRMARALCGA